MSVKRIAVFGNQAFSLINFRLNLMQDMQRCGYSVHALAPDFSAHDIARLRDIGIEPVHVPLSRTGLNPLTDFRNALSIRRTLKQVSPDILLSITIKPVIYGTLAARFAGVRDRFALVSGLGYAFSGGASSKEKLVHFAARILYRISLSQARAVFMQNPNDAEEFVSLKLVQREKITVVNGTGVDLTEWPLLPAATKPVTYALAARLIVEKGVRAFTEAARTLRSEFGQVRFMILGGLDTNPSAISREEIEQWVDEGIIEWPGHVDMHDWLGRISVFVLPSYYREGIPRSIQEAMASGRPIITTDSPGCRETVEQGANGFLIAPKDQAGLESAMRYFAENPSEVENMGLKSREIAKERFDAALINAKIMSTMGITLGQNFHG